MYLVPQRFTHIHSNTPSYHPHPAMRTPHCYVLRDIDFCVLLIIITQRSRYFLFIVTFPSSINQHFPIHSSKLLSPSCYRCSQTNNLNLQLNLFWRCSLSYRRHSCRDETIFNLFYGQNIFSSNYFPKSSTSISTASSKLMLQTEDTSMRLPYRTTFSNFNNPSIC